MLIADAAQGAAAAGILDADPGQRRVEIVAAVHEPGAGLDLVADADRRLLVIGPDGGGQAIGIVVHQADRLFVGADRHDAGDGAEAFLLHDGIGLIEIDQDLRRDIGGAWFVGLELPGIDGGPRPGLDGFCDLAADLVGRLGAHHRAEIDAALQRIAEIVFLRQRHGALDEILVDVLVDIDALDAAAGLARIEEGAVHQILDGMGQRGIGADIGGIAAAELQAQADEALRRPPRPPHGRRRPSR